VSAAGGRADRSLVATLGDYDVNRDPAAASSSAPFKQWIHMTVWDPAIALVVNFSALHGKGAAQHRMTAIVYSDRGVAGHVRRIPSHECRMPPGRATVVFGSNCTRRFGADYELQVYEPALDLRVSLTLRAATQASTMQGVRVAGDSRLAWTVVPRLLASGTIQYDGRVHALARAPAYRDRNWGGFEFGELSWDWGYATEGGGGDRTVVFTRLLDRVRDRVLGQDVLVWSRQHLAAVFRDREVAFGARGRLKGPVETVPPALALCGPGEATDAPDGLDVAARSSRGRLRIAFDRRATARILVPNDARVGVSSIYEGLGWCSVTGDVEGDRVEFTGHGFLESLHA
jgi:hypothetical protein